MTKKVEIRARVHRDMPLCCQQSVLRFAANDRYLGAGEPGDRIRCGCGNWIVYGRQVRGVMIGGWRLAEDGAACPKCGHSLDTPAHRAECGAAQ